MNIKKGRRNECKNKTKRGQINAKKYLKGGNLKNKNSAPIKMKHREKDNSGFAAFAALMP